MPMADNASEATAVAGGPGRLAAANVIHARRSWRAAAEGDVRSSRGDPRLEHACREQIARHFRKPRKIHAAEIVATPPAYRDLTGQPESAGEWLAFQPHFLTGSSFVTRECSAPPGGRRADMDFER